MDEYTQLELLLMQGIIDNEEFNKQLQHLFHEDKDDPHVSGFKNPFNDISPYEDLVNKFSRQNRIKNENVNPFDLEDSNETIIEEIAPAGAPVFPGEQHLTTINNSSEPQPYLLDIVPQPEIKTPIVTNTETLNQNNNMVKYKSYDPEIAKKLVEDFDFEIVEDKSIEISFSFGYRNLYLNCKVKKKF